MFENLSRRDFLLAAATAAGATWFDVPAVFAGTVEESAKKYAGFRMGIQSYSLRAFDIRKTVKIVRDDLDLHWIECYGKHYAVRNDEAHIRKMRALFKAHDMTCNAHGVNGIRKDYARGKALFEFAKNAGIRNISANPAKDAFDTLDKLCEEYPMVRIAIHNHGPGALYDKVADVVNAVKGHHRNIGACADLGHFIRSGEDPVRVIHALKGRLFGIHFKDFAEKKKRTKGVIVGRGHLDVLACLKALRAVRFPADGALSLEYEESKNNPVADLQECLRIIANAAAKIGTP